MITLLLFRNLFDVYLKPYFLEAYRPIRKGKIKLMISVISQILLPILIVHYINLRNQVFD